MPSEDTQFKKGHTPWNKGLKGWQKIKPKSLFKKGNLPQTTLQIGTEKTDKDGFVRIKVSNDRGDKNKSNRWKLKHHVIYQQHHPNITIGKDDRIIFLDGNNRNFDIDNLELISKREQLSLAHFGKLNDPEETKTLISLVRLRNKLLDLGVDTSYNSYKKYYDKNKEKFKESARKSAKKRREKKKHI